MAAYYTSLGMARCAGGLLPLEWAVNIEEVGLTAVVEWAEGVKYVLTNSGVQALLCGKKVDTNDKLLTPLAHPDAISPVLTRWSFSELGNQHVKEGEDLQREPHIFYRV
jgi:hypothetical protein